MLQFGEQVIKVGDNVKWYDTEIEEYDDVEEAVNRIFKVVSIDDDIIVISDGSTESEVREVELVKVDKDLLTVHPHTGWTTASFTLVFGYNGNLYYIEYANDNDTDEQDWWSDVFEYQPYFSECIGEQVELPADVVALAQAKAKELAQK